jgi:hypothetical protein
MFRPSAVDLILTKMMRNDPQDIGDIRFVISQEKIEPAELERAFASARPLDIAELQEIFITMKPLVRELAAPSKSIGEVAQNRARNLDPDWWSKLTQPSEPGRSKEKDLGLEL